MTFKIAHINTQQEEQSLIDHSRNTFKEVKVHAESLHLKNCLELISLLHDCGKASNDFQNYIKKAASGEKISNKVNHSSAGAQILFDICKNQNDKLDTTFKMMLAQCIVSHHGLCDFIDAENNNKFEKRCYPKNELQLKSVWSYFDQHHSREDILELYSNAKIELLSYFQQFFKFDKKSEIEKIECNFHIGALQRLLLSLLIHGDREDTRAFMDNITNEDTIHVMKIWDTSIINLETYISLLQDASAKTKINDLRKYISETCKTASNKTPGIYRLSCPTGSGKTLASLRFALNHAKSYKKKHIIYVAPYKTILEQNADVLKKFFKQDEILEHHSNIVSENESYDYYCSNWSKPVIMTTAVRFFDTLFCDKTTDIRRFHQLANSVIIFDEVQSIPVKMIHMFNCMMNFLSKYCQATLVLCTATQPLIEKVKHPIQLALDPDIIHNVEKLTTDFKRVHIENACRNGGYSMEDLSEFIFQKITPENSILVIVNTKQDAIDLYHACQQQEHEGILLYHLSTKMCPEHRSCVFKRIKENLGKKPLLCISTNLIEAGIDLSFDIVVRSLCGLSSILQSAGRCNRHGNNNTLGSMYLVNSNTEYIDKLPDVKKGKENMQSILSSQHLNKEGANVDELLSLKQINEYYQMYFFNRRDEMSYEKNIIGKPLFELIARRADKEIPVPSNLYSIYLGHALKTAGKTFQSIDSNTVGIIVPYRRGAELIQLLNGSISNTEKYKLLDEAQRYTINVYDNKFKHLSDNGVLKQIDFNGLYVLKDGYYKDDIGLDIHKELDEMFI